MALLKKYMKAYQNLDIRDIDENERWVSIQNIDGYEVSNYGRIKILRPFNGSYIKVIGAKSGYGYVGISINNKPKHLRVCRLVAVHFIPNPDNKPYVNHKDGNKLNDNHENLEWATASENMQHAYDNGLKTPTNRGVIATKNKTDYAFVSAAEASRSLDIKQSNVTLCCQLKRISTGGYTFRYSN